MYDTTPLRKKPPNMASIDKAFGPLTPVADTAEDKEEDDNADDRNKNSRNDEEEEEQHWWDLQATSMQSMLPKNQVEEQHDRKHKQQEGTDEDGEDYWGTPLVGWFLHAFRVNGGDRGRRWQPAIPRTQNHQNHPKYRGASS